MILMTAAGAFPIPHEVAEALPTVPPEPDPAHPDFEAQRRELDAWLDREPSHVIDYDRLQRWRRVQGELADRALEEKRPFTVTTDGLE